ncbi:hypothetical protein A6R68_09006 [Neotoma lepida]|uniref:Uncharacterized protein n=1 Tax=Neotoma lepida TaxID=56216 RepID=A0A1A6G0Z8_NEOLE|nr:hypothetical protein A6R68_09006 [Neotoma lepida]
MSLDITVQQPLQSPGQSPEMNSPGRLLFSMEPAISPPPELASLAANTFTIAGHAETQQLAEMLPSILNQLGADGLTSLRRLAEALPSLWMEKHHWLLERMVMMKSQIRWRIFMRLLRTRQTELKQLLKNVYQA